MDHALFVARLVIGQPGPGRGNRLAEPNYVAVAEDAKNPGNQPLARFQLKEAVNLMEMGAFVRPKYEENMTKFIAEDVEQVKQAIEAKDWDKFETAFHAMVDQANAYHELYDKEFLRWKIPDEPPPDLDMTPRR